MADFCTLIPVMSEEENYRYEILSCPVYLHMAYEAQRAGSKQAFYAGGADRGLLGRAGLCELPADGADGIDCEYLLILTAPTPAISCDTITALISAAEGQSAALYANGVQIGLYAKKSDYKKIGIFMDCEGAWQAPVGEQIVVTSALSAQRAQESIRMRTIMRHMRAGVFVTDMQSTHISPLATIGAGTVLLPGTLIYGASAVGSGCKIGPNAYLSDATVGDGVHINSSQVFESSIGDRATVGPFAYIRPGCRVEEGVKIGDFVELKKARIGRDAKVSHLTYLGDADVGERVNVGCGVVTVNYDGKNKHRTVIEDGSFIGCNVNLVAPVKIGKSAYIAAGSTITDDVEDEALAVARARQVNKPGWVRLKKRGGAL